MVSAFAHDTTRASTSPAIVACLRILHDPVASSLRGALAPKQFSPSRRQSFRGDAKHRTRNDGCCEALDRFASAFALRATADKSLAMTPRLCGWLYLFATLGLP